MREAFFLLLVILFSSSLCLGVDTNDSHLSSIGTRASVVTFWQEVWVEGREGKGLLLEPSSAAALCLQERLSGEEAAPRPTQYGQETP